MGNNIDDSAFNNLNFSAPISGSNWDDFKSYEKMVLIREFEAEAERQYKAAKIGGYCHLAIGQEAATVGVVDSMDKKDLLITGYRCHGFALAKGLSANSVMAELFGRENGCSLGRGGSMHLLGPEYGYYGGWGIVAGQLPLAVGLALGRKQQGEDSIVVCELGDGAVNMGAWHESLNLAAVLNLPVLFLVVNNVYGMGTSIERSSSEPKAYKRASSYNILGEEVNGNDVFKTHETSTRMINGIREKSEPAVLEVNTYRYRGHSVADSGLSYRTKEEVNKQKENDPLTIYEKHKKLSTEEIEEVKANAIKIVKNAVNFANESQEPDINSLAMGMYSNESSEQFSNMSPGAPLNENESVIEHIKKGFQSE